MPIEVHPFDGGFGCEVSGLNLPDIGAEDAAALRRAFLAHHVVVARGTRVSDDDLVAFGECFGALEISRHVTPLASRKEIMVISNIRENGKDLGRHPDGELIWHFDKVHQPLPNKAGILHAIDLPATGGETLFSDMSSAYEALPEPTRRKLEGLTAMNSFTYGANRPDEKVPASGPNAVHPAVRRIPETGRHALFVCRLMTDHLNGIEPDESARLLDDIFEHSEDPRFTYEHQWRVGDIVIWDNRCAMHSRRDFDPNETRFLKRLTVIDEIAPAI
jgi:taurine dioxygenase